MGDFILILSGIIGLCLLSIVNTEYELDRLKQGIRLIVLLTAFFVMVFLYSRDEGVRKYLNGEYKVDTISISPKGELLDIELKDIDERDRQPIAPKKKKKNMIYKCKNW